MPGAGYAPRSFARVEPFTRSPHPPPPFCGDFHIRAPVTATRRSFFPVASRLPSSRDSRSRPPAIRQGPHLRTQQPHPPCRHTVTACSSVLPPVSISPLPSQPPPCDAPDQACPIPISAPFSARLGSPDASSRPSAAYSAIKCLSYKHRYDPLPHHSTNFLEGKFAYLKI